MTFVMQQLNTIKVLNFINSSKAVWYLEGSDSKRSF